MCGVSDMHKLTLTLKHIRGINNSVADALSRFQDARFKRRAPHADQHATDFPRKLLEQLQQTYAD